MGDLARGDFQFCLMPYNPEFYIFKNPGILPYNGTQGLIEDGESIYNTATNVINYSTAGEFSGNNKLAGGIALNILVTGAPAQTNVLQIEVMYHLEGTPVVSNVPTLIVSGSSPYPGGTAVLEDGLRAAGKEGWWTFLVNGMREQYNNGNLHRAASVASRMARGGRNPALIKY
jgi:hypothetical protein